MKARVVSGRLVLDEPTDLPEGIEVPVVFADGDEIDPEERRALYEEILAGCDELDRGLGEDAEVVITRLRARM